MSHEAWLELADLYALGALSPEETARLEAHLATACPVCAERVRDSREALVLLPRALSPVTPPPAVKARLLEAIDREPAPASAPAPSAAVRPAPAATEPASPRAPGRVVGLPAGRERRRREPAAATGWWGWAGWTAAAVAAALLVTVGWSFRQTVTEMHRLEARLGTLEGELARRRAELADREATLRLLADPAVHYVALAGQTPSPQARAWLLWHPVHRTGFLLTRDLPPPPAGRAYELWAIGTEPVPAGVFQVDATGRAFFRLPEVPAGASYDKFAVTLEPEGGVPKPTGAIHLLGTL